MATKGGAGQKGSGSDNSGSKAEGGGLGGPKGGGGGGKVSGGMGSFGDRYGSYGGLGYSGPGAGLGFHPGDASIPGSRNSLHNIPTRPGSWSNIGGALSFVGPTGPFRAAAMGLTGNDPYSGPTGTGNMVEHDHSNNAYGQMAQLNPIHQQALMRLLSMQQPASPQGMLSPQYQPQQMPGQYKPIGGLSPYGVNLPGFTY